MQTGNSIARQSAMVPAWISGLGRERTGGLELSPGDSGHSPNVVGRQLDQFAPSAGAARQVRRVRAAAEVKWCGPFAFVGEALTDGLVDRAKFDNDDHVVRFRGRDLGLIERHGVLPALLRPAQGSAKPQQTP